MTDEIFVEKDDIKQEGFLWKQSKVLKNMRKRWFVLTSDYLCSFKTQGDYRKPTEFIRLIECTSVTSGDADKNDLNSLSVVTPDRTLYIIAASAVEKDLWMGAIINSCLPGLLFRGLGFSLSNFAIAEEPDKDSEEAYNTGLAVMTRVPSSTPQSLELQLPKSWKNALQAASQFLPMPFASKRAFMQRAESLMMFGIKVPSMVAEEDENSERFQCCSPETLCDKADSQLCPTKNQVQQPEVMLVHCAQQRAGVGKENEGWVASISPCSDSHYRVTEQKPFRSTTEFKLLALNADGYNFKLKHTTLDGKIVSEVKDFSSTHPTASKVKSALATGTFLQCPPKVRGARVKMSEGEVANISPRSDAQSRATQRKPIKSTTEFQLSPFNADGYNFKLKHATLDGKIAPEVKDFSSTHPTASKVKSALATGTFLQCPPKQRASRTRAP